MKTLILVRHAKSDWGNDTITDLFRPLNTRGYSDAQILAKQLAQKISPPQLWLTSPAIRAYSTGLLFAEAFNYDTEKLVINKKIYEAGVKTLQSIVTTVITDNIETAFMFGHNPGFTKFFNQFSDAFADNIPTCGVISLSNDVLSWKDFLNTKIKNDFYLYPKEFR
ncbi:MAG TPA: histidine phosphatase family protein [Bacteroidia bacterium]|jgi:phosphohistidine phosphatase|nr:histidine phosphatase family protein [Bacteroidia bacterium]